MANASNYKILSNGELNTFFEQLGMILRSGISAVEGISIMEEDAATEDATAILRLIHEALENSGILYLALKESGVFPPYALNMIHIGEEAGKLEEVMASLAAYYDREETIAGEIKNAVTYPLVMIGIMVIIIVILLVKVLPVFQQVYRQLGSEMTGFSRSLLNIGNFLGSYGFLFIAFLALFVGIFVWLIKTGKKKLPFSRKFYLSIASGRFASGMALTLSSGLDTDESLSMISDLVEDPDMQDKIKTCQGLMADGTDFAEALTKPGIFSGVYARMVSVAYKTGSTDEVMQKLALQYQDETDTRITSLISILEPSLVAALSIVVGMILLSVMLPLLGILSGINAM